MSIKTGVGILGGGGILGSHVAGFKKTTDDCQVLAVAEPREERHADIRKHFGPQIKICRDYQEVLAMPSVRAVDILLPHDMHVPAVRDAAKAKKQILVEKVMARNIYECDQMIKACEDNQVSLTVCHDRRHNPGWVALKEVIDSGKLGDIFLFKLEHNQDVLPAGSWIASKERLGGGAIMSCLTHQIDALRWYGGEIEKVAAMTKILPDRMEGESVGVMSAQMRSGAIAQLSINWFTRGYMSRDHKLWYEMVHVCGTKGEAYFRSDIGTFCMVYGEKKDQGPVLYDKPAARDAINNFAKIEYGPESGHQRLIEEWIKLVQGKSNTISTTGFDSRKTVEVAEAAYYAAKEERTVALPLTPLPWAKQFKIFWEEK
jgi:UDP-N-acetyl-2-amino-2-deoxyglucuronate dehydrogenase